MLGHGNEEREGALLRRLKDAGQGSRPGTFGFSTGGAGTKRRDVVVVARVEHGATLAVQMRALAEAAVDAIEVVIADSDQVEDVIDGARDLEIPCGVFLPGGSDRDWSALAAATGIDWIHLAGPAPARLLAGKGPTRLVGVTPDEPPGRLAGLGSLRADVVVVEGRQQGGPFTVDTLLALCTIRAATKGPVLAGSRLALTPADAEVLRDHGIEGIIVPSGVDAAHSFITAIEAL